MLLLVETLVLALASTGPAGADTYQSSRLLLSPPSPPPPPPPSSSSSSFFFLGRAAPRTMPLTKTSRFVVVSEGQYDHAHHTHQGREEPRARAPHFAGGNASRQVFLGDTVTLDCTIHDMANESVSWMRSVDDMLELITWDSHTYAKDNRYALVRETGDRWHRWQLVIRRTRADDGGQYRCQLATQPPMVLVVNLNVTEPVARIVDERGTKVVEKHYNSGSMIELKCIIERVPFPHGAVIWRRDAIVLTYNTSRGGISVKGDKSSGYLRSRLYVADAAPSDSGIYSCWYKNFTHDTVAVHVIAGENSAAMQHDAVPGSTSRGSSSQRTASLTILMPFLLFFLLVSDCLKEESGAFVAFSSVFPNGPMRLCPVLMAVASRFCHRMVQCGNGSS